MGRLDSFSVLVVFLSVWSVVPSATRGRLRVHSSTGLVTRSCDVLQVSLVINFELPEYGELPAPTSSQCSSWAVRRSNLSRSFLCVPSRTSGSTQGFSGQGGSGMKACGQEVALYRG